MYEEIKEFIVNYIEKKGKLPKDIDLDSFNFIDSGYVDSIGVIKFVIEIEEKFGIEEISDDEMLAAEFKTIGGLIGIIERKMGF